MNKDFIKGVSIGCALAVVAGSTLVFAEPVRHNIEAVYNDIKIIVHGEVATPSNGEPFIYDGTTYLPVRAVAEALGEVVDWDGNTNTVYIGTERPIATPTPTPTATNLKTGDYKSDGSGRVLVIENRNGQDVLIGRHGDEYALDRDERGVVVGLSQIKEGIKSNKRAMPGDPDYYDGSGETWEYYQSRPNLTLYETDPTRPRAKAGDTIITAEGQSYVLEVGASGVLGEGLPIATDLGRIDSAGGVVKDGFTAGTGEFGWITSDVNTGSCTYKVYRTGEGHWDFEWSRIRMATKPQYDGTHGQVTDDGYWVFDSGYNFLKASGDWRFIPLNPNILDYIN